MLSTVSGGTITGIVYTLQKQQGRSFQDIFDFIKVLLRTLDLIKLGVEKLQPRQKIAWQNPLKAKKTLSTPSPNSTISTLRRAPPLPN